MSGTIAGLLVIAFIVVFFGAIIACILREDDYERDREQPGGGMT